MSMFDKIKQGALKAGVQASTLLKEGSNRVQSSSQSFAQGFSLPGEAEKAAKILATFLGLFPSLDSPEIILNLFAKRIRPILNLPSIQFQRPFCNAHEVPPYYLFVIVVAG
jgi:SH3 domain-containing YSC84-like protein 1